MGREWGDSGKRVGVGGDRVGDSGSVWEVSVERVGR